MKEKICLLQWQSFDMDWHLVDIEEKYGSGWTGYTWNRAFFPKPIRFLERLHEKGMRTTLNLHPADGVRAFEEMYEPMAKAMGVDIEKQEPVLCDLANPNFWKLILPVFITQEKRKGWISGG